jgi:hypothetical protein
VTARTAKKGVWAQDATLTGFRLVSRTQLTGRLVIVPKLFRRLAEYLSLDEAGTVNWPASRRSWPSKMIGCSVKSLGVV